MAWYRDIGERQYARLCTGVNTGRGILGLSDLPYPWPDYEGPAAEEVLDDGVSEVWTFGLETNTYALPFLRPDIGCDKEQRVVILAPTCKSAFLGGPNANDMQDYMFTSVDGTVAAGGIGVTRNGMGVAHRALMTALADEVITAPGGTTYAQLALNAARAVASRYPGYAATVTTFGAYLLCPAGRPVAAATGPGARGGEPLRARTTRDGNALWLGVRSPVAGPGSLEVFDVLGRRVARGDAKGLKAGWNPRVFDLGRTSRGVYFVKLTTGAGGGRRDYKAKFVIAE